MCSGEGQWDVGHVYLFIFASKEVQARDKISHDRFEMRSLQCWGELISAQEPAEPGRCCQGSSWTTVSGGKMNLGLSNLLCFPGRQPNSRQVVGEGLLLSGQVGLMVEGPAEPIPAVPFAETQLSNPLTPCHSKIISWKRQLAYHRAGKQ